MKDAFTISHDLAKLRQKEFPLEDILSVTTGVVLSLRKKADAFYEVVGHLVGNDDMDTCEVVMQQPFARDMILKEHPQLKDVTFPGFSDPDLSRTSKHKIIRDWMIEQTDRFGPSLMLTSTNIPLSLTQEEVIDVLAHLNPNAMILR